MINDPTKHFIVAKFYTLSNTKKSMEIKILKEFWSSEKGSLMSYLTTSNLYTCN